jgi:hypothetical protein
MSEPERLDLIDRPMMPKLVAVSSRAIGSTLSLGDENSREDEPAGNGGMNRLAAPADLPELDLEPLEEGLASVQRQHLKLRTEVLMQSGSLKRIEDRLEMVREATDRNAQEQQDLLEDLKAFSSKVKTIAMVGISLLVVGILLESTMYFHLKSVLP